MTATRDIEKWLQAEIVRVTGCTEPVSVAFAFLTARRNLLAPFVPALVQCRLSASPDVLRNASTAVVPYLNERGLPIVAAAGLSSASLDYDVFPAVLPQIARMFTRRRRWLTVSKAKGRRGVYVRASVSMPGETVTVTIEGRHDEIRSIARNDRILFRAPARKRQRSFSPADIHAEVSRRNNRLEGVARDFIVRQVRGDRSLPMAARIAELIRARMCGSTSPVMTICGSGNHGIFIGAPLYDLYRRRGDRVLPAVLLALLTDIHMTGKKSRISDECGLGTKAAPALAAGLAYAEGANLAEIRRLMKKVANELGQMKCHGARPSCGGKGARAYRVVMKHVRSMASGRASGSEDSSSRRLRARAPGRPS